MDEPAIKQVNILKAIKSLRKLVEVTSSDTSRKKALLENEDGQPIFMQVAVKKIPPRKTIKFIRVPLKNSLVKDNTEVCLFAGDLDKRNHKAEVEPDVMHYQNLLEEHGITQITQVITLRQLRTEFKTYECKRQLMGAYDLFLADSRIAGVLHRFLGKAFYKKRKIPIQINMKTANLKEQVEKALSLAIFPFTAHGNSCTSEIAHLQMKDKQILRNLVSSLQIISRHIPGKWENVLGVYIKTAKSKAIPLYMSFDSANDVHMQKRPRKDFVEDKAEELSTLPDAKVKVFRNGHVFVHYLNGSKSGDESKVKKIGPKGKKRKNTKNMDVSRKGNKRRKVH